jgi:hypothetical protein
MLSEIKLLPNNKMIILRMPGEIVSYETIPSELLAAYNLFIAFGNTARSEKEISAEKNYLFIKNNATNTQKLEMVMSYPIWESSKVYAIGDEFQFINQLYKVVQAHTSQMDWLPNTVPALYTKIVAAGTIPNWVQPTGAQDAYAIGAKVTFEGKVYESKINANTWSPTGYPAGWQLVV